MKVLESCKCLFGIEHKFIPNNNYVGDIGCYKVDTITRHNFGLCSIPSHRQNKTVTERQK